MLTTADIVSLKPKVKTVQKNKNKKKESAKKKGGCKK